MKRLARLILVSGLGLTAAAATAATGAAAISYNRDVRPILSDNCFLCHGPDQKTRKGKFRLDVREDAIAKGAILPGKPDESEVVARIFAKTEDDVMPPASGHKRLTPAQKELLRRWIASGAEYQKHWAYVPPVKPATRAGLNPIDSLVRERLREVGLKPLPPADRRTLVRRLYFDLIGLPPKPEDVESFARDQSPDAAQKLIERLLAAPQFGERMALGWLDVVRFADTIGYHSDNPRNIWPYRDYVIQSFNANKRFDQFTREQLAGDLLPGAGREQKVGSAFNRLLLTTEEGGAQPKDYEARMLTDRVRAVSAVWLGQTIGCAQCHDHKFDPVTMRDFYSLGAFFADIEEPIIGRREDGMLLPDKAQAAELERLQDSLARAQQQLDAPEVPWDAAFAKWQIAQSEAIAQERRWTALSPADARAQSEAKLVVQKDKSLLAKGAKAETDAYFVSFTNGLEGAVALRLEALPHSSLPAKGPGRADNGNFVLNQVLARILRPDQSSNAVQFASARADFEEATGAGSTWSAASVINQDGTNANNGWAVLPQTDQPHQLVLSFVEAVSLQPGESLLLELRQNHPQHALGHFRLSVTTDAAALRGPLFPPPRQEIADVLLVPTDQRDDQQKEKLFTQFKNVAPETAVARKQLADARKAKDEFEARLARCLVTTTNSKPRTVRILPRGNFLDETGEIVSPALPAYLAGNAVRPAARPPDRLDLANWLVARENPLTARVVMNRLWKQFFGLGLSRVVDDLGAQGELPPNQPLLDWLACEFMDAGWDMKHMVRLIVSSETYQRTSIVPKKLRARDPQNRALAVQSRWRLDAELVRDNALFVSGLLVDKIGGPSVKPYQPDGYWENLNFPPRTYEATVGPEQYSRGLYVWWQRSFLHPSMLAFDAPSREECAAERNRSNIPQQALVLLNDPTYVEAARALAVRTLQGGGADAKSRLRWAWRQVLARAPRTDELKTMQTLLAKQLAEYRADPAAARKFLQVGQAPLPAEVDLPELAAWTNLARVLLNLHETVTRS